MDSLSLPNCEPYGEMMIFVHDRHVELMMHRSTLQKCRVLVAAALDNFAESVQRFADGTISFTYYRLGWMELCLDLMNQEKHEASLKDKPISARTNGIKTIANSEAARKTRVNRRNSK